MSKTLKPKVRKSLKLLSVPLTKDEHDKMTGELLKYMDELDGINREKKEAADGFKTRVENKESAIVGCRVFIREGYVKSIACEETYDWEAGVATTVRLDTGAEVSQRKITAAERQESFNFENTIETGATPEEMASTLDSMYADAKKLAVSEGAISLAVLSEKLGVGFGRANQLMLLLEATDVVAPGSNNEKPRKVLLKPEAKKDEKRAA